MDLESKKYHGNRQLMIIDINSIQQISPQNTPQMISQTPISMAPTLERTDSDRNQNAQQSIKKKKDSQTTGTAVSSKVPLKFNLNIKSQDHAGEFDIENQESPAYKLERINRKT